MMHLCSGGRLSLLFNPLISFSAHLLAAALSSEFFCAPVYCVSSQDGVHVTPILLFED